MLTLSFTPEDIKESMWSILEDKAPGLDGFNSGFYKVAWDIVGLDFVDAVQDFFANGTLLHSWNTTAITLIPNVTTLNTPGDYRPISCCNVVYKCISKLICRKFRLVLGSIISPNQGAFVEGRSILHSILLCQDIVKHYGRKNCSPRCLLKIDLRKAYDTLDWDFIHDMLIALNFPRKFTKIVMACVTST